MLLKITGCVPRSQRDAVVQIKYSIRCFASLGSTGTSVATQFTRNDTWREWYIDIDMYLDPPQDFSC
jgi:hypothetical protein